MDLTSDVSSVGGQVPLTKKDALKKYRECIQMSKKWREHEGYDRMWERLRDLYAGQQFTHISDEDRIAVNIAFATINVIAPSIAVNHPKITVNAKKMEDDDRAVITEAVINYWWKHFDFKPHFRRAVKDYLVYGHGWLKVGYRYEERPIPLTEDEIADKFHIAKGEADEYAIENPELAAQVPTDGEIYAGLDTEKQIAVHDHPFVERVSPFDIYVDPEATSEQDMLFIAQRITRPLDEVKRDKRYPVSVRKRLEADGEITQNWRDQRKKYGDSIKRVTIWEFYDLERKTLSVFTEGGDRFLVDPIPMPYAYGVPFVMLRNYDVPDQFYPMGDLEAIAPLQDELNEVRSSMVAARKQDLPKTMYRKSLNNDAIDALRSNERNQMVGIDSDDPFEQLIAPVPQASGNAMLYQHSDVIEQDVDRISGVNEYMRGGVPETRRTATEASIIQDAANSRSADKLATIETTIAEVARRVVVLAKSYLTQQQVAYVVGPNQAQVWVPFTRRDITDDANFEVEAGSTQPMNESFRRQQAMQMLNALAPFMEAQIINVPALLQHVLQEGFGVINPGRFIAQEAPIPEGPDVRLIESMQYKDAPPDIRRQIEAAAGFKPSVMDILPQGGEQDDGPGGGEDKPKPKQAPGDDPAGLGAKASNRREGK